MNPTFHNFWIGLAVAACLFVFVFLVWAIYSFLDRHFCAKGEWPYGNRFFAGTVAFVTSLGIMVYLAKLYLWLGHR